MNQVPELTIDLLDSYDRAWLENAWKALEAEADGSFFTSWDWIDTWLQCLPAEMTPVLLKVTDCEKLVALGLFGRGSGGRLLLHESGDSELDVLAVEYNGLECNPRYSARVWKEVLSEFARRKTPLLRLSGVSLPLAPLADSMRAYERLEREDSSFQISLDAVRSSPAKSLLDLMSGNTKTLLRKSLKRVGEQKALTVEAAQDLSQAKQFMSELKALHELRWQARGLSGAFGPPFFQKFHEALFDRHWNDGHLDVLKISAGERLIGYLYNFKYGQSVLQYQGGFDYSDSKLQPGLMCHLAAVEYYKQFEYRWYDLLAGESRYKKSITQESRVLYWGELQRKTPKAALVRALRKGKRLLRPKKESA